MPNLCPICQKPVADEVHKPFCSARCAEVDLGRWFSGQYAVASDETPQDSDNAESQKIK